MFITRCLELGVDVQTIARFQGHKDGGKLILDTYGHVSDAHSQRMADACDRAASKCYRAQQRAASLAYAENSISLLSNSRSRCFTQRPYKLFGRYLCAHLR